MKNLIFIFMLLLSPVGAQAEWWINLGTGKSLSSGFREPTSFNASVTRQQGKLLTSLRSVYIGDVMAEGLTDIGFLLGIGTTNPESLSSISVGLAGVKAYQRRGGFWTSTTETKFFTLGVPIEAQLFFRPFGNGNDKVFSLPNRTKKPSLLNLLSHLGFGIYGFANLNRSNSFGGINLALQLGTFK